MGQSSSLRFVSKPTRQALRVGLNEFQWLCYPPAILVLTYLLHVVGIGVEVDRLEAKGRDAEATVGMYVDRWSLSLCAKPCGSSKVFRDLVIAQ